MADWQTVLLALYRILGKRDDSDMPSDKLHWRFSNDKTKIIIQAHFDELDLDPTNLTRLCKYISDALGGKYTPAQVKTALVNNVTVWQLNKPRMVSGEAARAYLKANAGEWETTV
jgi:hypothetical protein